MKKKIVYISMLRSVYTKKKYTYYSYVYARMYKSSQRVLRGIKKNISIKYTLIYFITEILTKSLRIFQERTQVFFERS